MVNKSKPTFETQLAELNEIVSKMEHGELPLTDSIDAYEKGIKLVKACQQTLQEAQQKVMQLNDGKLESFDDNETPN